jgi:metal-responsive CopG/Arc/MetJ family transcriptional regulator
VISVSLPRELVERANELIPKARRSRVISEVLTAFLDSISRKKLQEEYRAYYTGRSPEEATEEIDLLREWAMNDAEAWAILVRESSRDRRSPR